MLTKVISIPRNDSDDVGEGRNRRECEEEGENRQYVSDTQTQVTEGGN